VTDAIVTLCLSAGIVALAFFAGKSHESAAIEAEKVQIRAEVQAARDEAAREGATQTAKLVADLQRLKVQNNANRSALQRALRTKIECPQSGEVGDVLVPADVVRRMFAPSGPSTEDPGAD
jgi:Flp pilus assembly protein TadB